MSAKRSERRSERHQAAEAKADLQNLRTIRHGPCFAESFGWFGDAWKLLGPLSVELLRMLHVGYRRDRAEEDFRRDLDSLARRSHTGPGTAACVVATPHAPLSSSPLSCRLASLRGGTGVS